MSKRAVCKQCNKALSACICQFIKKIDNRYFLTVLQDPSEQKKAIGTARILELSLTSTKTIVGEYFNSDDFDLNNTFLVFPDEQVESIEVLQEKKKINQHTQFILLDGSWKKAYKLLMSNPFLKTLPKVNIKVAEQSNYRIRKSPRKDGLSTVEAGYYLLSELENNKDKFMPLLDVFKHMIDFQINNIPTETYNKNYKNNHPSESSVINKGKV